MKIKNKYQTDNVDVHKEEEEEKENIQWRKVTKGTNEEDEGNQ